MRLWIACLTHGGIVTGLCSNRVFHCLGDEPVAINAAPVIADFNHNLVALVICGQLYCAVGRLAQTDAFCGRFNAVIHRITHQVRQRLGQHIQNALVQVGILAGDQPALRLYRMTWQRRAPPAGKRRKRCSTGTMRIFITDFCRSFRMRDWKCQSVRKPRLQRIFGKTPPEIHMVWCSMLLAMISSPTRFSTESIRSASTRSRFSRLEKLVDSRFSRRTGRRLRRSSLE